MLGIPADCKVIKSPQSQLNRTAAITCGLKRTKQSEDVAHDNQIRDNTNIYSSIFSINDERELSRIVNLTAELKCESSAVK